MDPQLLCRRERRDGSRSSSPLQHTLSMPQAQPRWRRKTPVTPPASMG